MQSLQKAQPFGVSCSLKQQSNRRGTAKLPSTPVCCGLNFELIFNYNGEKRGVGVFGGPF